MESAPSAMAESVTPDQVAPDQAHADQDVPAHLGVVQEEGYLFYYPQDFTPVENPGVAYAYADPSGDALLDVVVQEVGGAQGRLEMDLCRQLAGLMMADLMQKDMGGGMGGLGGMGGADGEEGPKIEVQPVKPPTLEDVGPDLQRCSFAFAHNAEGPWKIIEQHLYYKLMVPKLYTVTMRLPMDQQDGSSKDPDVRPALEAFQVR